MTSVGCGSVAHSRTVRSVCGESTASVRVTWGPEITVYTGTGGYQSQYEYRPNSYVPVYTPPNNRYYYSAPQPILIYPSQQKEYQDMRYTKEQYTGKTHHHHQHQHQQKQRHYGLQPR